MTSTQIAHIRAHLAGVAKLLLGDRMMKPSLSIIAGEPLDTAGRLKLAEMGAETGIDIVHLRFAIDSDDMPVMTGIDIVMPRNLFCFIQSDCQLSLIAGQARAVIMPRDEVRGHFRVLPGEIVQVASKPKALATGVDRAAQRLATLVRDGVALDKQVVLHEWC